MINRKTLILLLIVATVLCGLPGLCGACSGSVAIFGSLLPDSSVAAEDAALTVSFLVMMVGVSLLCIAIPAGLGFWGWWVQRRPQTPMGELTIPGDDF